MSVMLLMVICYIYCWYTLNFSNQLGVVTLKMDSAVHDSLIFPR
jgi:hypothetical protein